MMRSHESHRDAVSWIILIVGICLIMLGVWAWAVLAHAEGVCGSADWSCNGTTWVPTIDGEELTWGDLTAEECVQILMDLDLQERLFLLECVEKPVYRTEG